MIADALAKNGTPNHLLVNRVTEYPAEDFYRYCIAVAEEIECRGARVTKKSVDTLRYTFKVYYEDDALCNYGKKRSKLVRAKNKEQALERFKEKFGIIPLYAV